MDNFVLLHGSGSGPDMWFPWLNDSLTKHGHNVWMPHMPDSENPDLAKQLPFLQNSGKINNYSVLVGHSASCPLILSFLEATDFVVKKAILVAGYFSSSGENSKIWQEKYDFAKIKSHCEDFIFVVSDNDPWGCNDQLARPYFDQLGGKLIIIKNGGHFGSNRFKQPLFEFPFLLKLLLQ